MDIVTQGLLGGSLALSLAKSNQARYAAAIGFASALVADTDVFIASASDPLLNLEFHRHFTHSLFFIPFGALIAALLLWLPLRRGLAFETVYLYALLGYATAGLLDACTSYGTHLLWPFSDTRFAWSIIAIVDPLFSLTLLVGLGVGFKYLKPAAARVGLGLAGTYLLLGLWQHHQALDAATELARERGHALERIIVKPTMANLVLWRSVYQSGGDFHVDAVRVGLFGARRIYPGVKARGFELERDRPRLDSDSRLARDIGRFFDLSNGFVVPDPNRDNVLIDVRYSMLPIRIEPMWGIDLNVASAAEHAAFRIYRDRPANTRELFIAMLFGRDLPG